MNSKGSKLMLTILLVGLCTAIESCTATQTQSQAKGTKKLTVIIPGMLSTLIGEDDKYLINDLTIEGKLNNNDLRFLRDMAGSDFNEQPTKGMLKRVDLSNVTFVKSDDSYIFKNGKEYYITGEYTIPPFLFRSSSIEEVILNEKTDTLKVGAFEKCSLRRIKLPENVYMEDWMFNGDEQLEEVIFPNYFPRLGQNCFPHCKKLKNLTLHNVGAIYGYSINDIDSLEAITIDGYLLHIDGYAFNKCPFLKEINYNGVVLTTGGATVAEDCASLENINFNNTIFYSNFGLVTGCPSFKHCTAKGNIIQMKEFAKDFIEYTPTEVTMKDLDNVAAAVDYFYHKQEYDRQSRDYIVNVGLDMASRYSLMGEKEKALNMLEECIATGYTNYSHLQDNEAFDTLRNEKKFQDLVNFLVTEYNPLRVLKKSAPYQKSQKEGPAFTYDSPSDTALARIRKHFNLEKIAGNGDEISRIKNVMYWLHDQIPHDGSNGLPENIPLKAIELIETCKAQGRGLNCRGHAMVLSELYLALGIPSRFITCQPKAYDTDTDCHVINMVWSKTLNKWIWIDSSFAAYVTDENGLLLHPGEVRQRLIEGKPLVLNEDANWNHKTKQTKEYYLESYMAKNLYLISAHLNNGSQTEGGDNESATISLMPKDFNFYWAQNTTTDYDYFWQSPQVKR